jgi:hypothetical protein
MSEMPFDTVAGASLNGAVPMKMLARLRYLLEEGFEVYTLLGYEGDPEAGWASISYYVPGKGHAEVCEEHFLVNREEMEACSDFLIRHIK